MWKRIVGYLAAIAGCITIAMIGCSSGSDELAYIGGGVPPGEPDIGGVVVASADTAQAATAATDGEETPVVGATVKLYRGRWLVGTAETGDEGYFRFRNPATGSYRMVVEPPEGSDLQEAEVTVVHTHGQQTFRKIQLQRGAGHGPPQSG